MVHPDEPPLKVKNRPLLLLGVMAAMIMQTLDATIANVALPHMSASLGATRDTISWVLTSYVLASAVVLPLSGWLVDRVGVRRMMLGSVILFTAASMLCGAAQSLDQMVLFRILQGLAGAFLGPLAQTVILDSSTAAERPRMMSIYTQGIMLGPISGPIIGGYLTDNFSWRWVFYVNLPVGIICFVLLLLYLPSTPRGERKIDLFGWLLIAMAVSGLQLVLDRGQAHDWFSSPEILIEAVVAGSCLWMAVVHLATARIPLFPREIYRDQNFMVGMVFFGLIGMVMMSVMALLPGLMQQIYGYSPIQCGLLLAPRGIGMLLSMTLFGRFSARIDARLQLATGFALMALSLWMMDPRHWHQFCLHPGQYDRVCDAQSSPSRRCLGHEQSYAQCRFIGWNCRNLGPSGAQCADQPCRNQQSPYRKHDADCRRHEFNLCAGHRHGAGNRGRDNQPAGVDDRLYRQFHADERGLPRSHPVAVAGQTHCQQPRRRYHHRRRRSCALKSQTSVRRGQSRAIDRS